MTECSFIKKKCSRKFDKESKHCLECLEKEITMTVKKVLQEALKDE